VKVLVTGADGFVGRHLVARLVETGHEVGAACRPGGEPLERWLGESWRGAVQVVPLELTDAASVRAGVSAPYQAVVHLAGTARVLEALSALRLAGTADPVVLVVSTAEVYGAGHRKPREEHDPVAPRSPYAASKAGGELAALEVWRRTGLRVVIARPFPHTGAGQPAHYVAPAFAQRLRAAKRAGEVRVPTGNLDPVRELLHVRDVVEAYLGLLANGAAGEVYNIAGGQGVSLRTVFQLLAQIIGVDAEPVPDPALVRGSDIDHLVGDGSKLRHATGWSPTFTLEQTLRDLVDAQAN
jgi:GDP-4-dehydro-6-deoxy-D-mannose reductase